MSVRGCRLFVCGALWLAASAGHASSRFFVIPTEQSPAAAVATGGPLEMDIYVQDVAGLAELLHVSPPPPAGSDHFRYRAVRYPQIEVARDRSWLESTFVVDHDEPAVRSLYEQWMTAVNPARTPAGVIGFVSATVRPSLERGFDVASMVARQRRGDCTEYAVLTAALARRAGLPARVAFGVALLHGPDGPAGMGHAWTEILDGGRWAVADAALAESTIPVTYIPYGILEDEGPGFGGLRGQMVSRWIRRIVVVGGDPGGQSPARGAELEHP